MGGSPDPVLVFSSARAASSFEFWLFRKLTPEARRLALAFAAACLPRWDASSHAGRDSRARRHGPDLFELRVTCSVAAQRRLAGRPARPEGPPFSVSVFFLREAHATILLSGAALTASSRRSRPGTPGLREARLQLRELRQAERAGFLRQRLSLISSKRSKAQTAARSTLPRASRCSSRTPRGCWTSAGSARRSSARRDAKARRP